MRLAYSTFSVLAEMVILDSPVTIAAGVLTVTGVAISLASWFLDARPLIDDLTGCNLQNNSLVEGSLVSSSVNSQ